MRSQNKQLTKPRSYQINRIKQTVSYDAGEIAKLFGVHRNTVRHWIKDGLRTIDDRRPALVHGATLKAFLGARREARRQKCGPGQFFCFKCRAPRKAWGGTADVAPHTDKIVKLTALCSVCETAMHRTFSRADLPKLVALIDLQPMASERLRDRLDANKGSSRCQCKL